MFENARRPSMFELQPILAGASSALMQAGAAPPQMRNLAFAQGMGQIPAIMQQQRQQAGVDQMRGLQMAKFMQEAQREKEFKDYLASLSGPQTPARSHIPPDIMKPQPVYNQAELPGFVPDQGEMIQPAGMFNMMPGGEQNAGASPQQRPSLMFGGQQMPPEALKLAGMMGPERGSAFLMQQMAKEPKAAQIVELYDDQGRPYKAQMMPDGTTKRLGGSKSDTLSPEAFRQQEDLRKAGRSQTNVNNNLPMQEREEDKAVGKGFGEQYVKIQEGSMGVPAKIASTQKLGEMLDQVRTGKFAGTTLEIKRAAKGLGIDLTAMGIADNVPQAQAAQALSREMALQLRNPAGGAGMPGALSDKDREFLESMVANLDKDPQANKTLIDARVKMLKREQDVAKIMRDYRKKHGRLDEGVYDELDAFAQKNPLFAAAPGKGDPGLKKKYGLE